MTPGDANLGPLALLRVLVAKDLRRTWRNPLPWLINLIVPLMMTALLGLVFGGGGNNQALGRTRFAVVDEDRSVLSDFLRGAANQGRAGDHLEAVFMDRAAALERVNAGKISAVLIIETNFTRNYLTGRAPVSLQLIKNPAESISPAVLEELLGAAVAGLNVISRNFNSQFPEWQRVVEGHEDYHKVATLIDQAGDKIKAAKQFVDPPLVSYQKEEPTNDEVATANGKPGTGEGVASVQTGLASTFSYLLVGMSALFLLFLGQNALTDLHRELRQRTFERYQTLHQALWPFIASKLLFTVVMLLLCSAIMLIGGGWAFGIHWQQPLTLAALVAAYCCFVAALFGVLVALVPDERRAAALNNVIGMGMGLVGGCAFPTRQFPEFLREHVTPLMPTYWLVDTVRSLQSGVGPVSWGWAGLKLLACAGVLLFLTAILFRRKFNQGQRA